MAVKLRSGSLNDMQQAHRQKKLSANVKSTVHAELFQEIRVFLEQLKHARQHKTTNSWSHPMSFAPSPPTLSWSTCHFRCGQRSSQGCWDGLATSLLWTALGPWEIRPGANARPGWIACHGAQGPSSWSLFQALVATHELGKGLIGKCGKFCRTCKDGSDGNGWNPMLPWNNPSLLPKMRRSKP